MGSDAETRGDRGSVCISAERLPAGLLASSVSDRIGRRSGARALYLARRGRVASLAAEVRDPVSMRRSPRGPPRSSLDGARLRADLRTCDSRGPSVLTAPMDPALGRTQTAYTWWDRCSERREAAPSAGLEPAHTAPEADALSAELRGRGRDRKSTRLNSSHITISYAVFCLKKKKKKCTRFLFKNKTQKTKKQTN